MRIEQIPICTMGTGRWYALVEDGHEYDGYERVCGEFKAVDELGRELAIFLVDEDAVCEELEFRHEDDPQWEGPWDASEEEYEAMYKALAEAAAGGIMDDIALEEELAA